MSTFESAAIKTCTRLTLAVPRQLAQAASLGQALLHYSYFSLDTLRETVSRTGSIPMVVGEDGQLIVATETNQSGRSSARDGQLVMVSWQTPERREMIVDPIAAHQYKLRKAADATTLIRETSALAREERTDSGARSGASAMKSTLG